MMIVGVSTSMVGALLSVRPGVAAAVQKPPVSALGRGPLDVRVGSGRPAAVDLGLARAQGDLRDSLGGQGIVQVDPVTATPRVVAKLDGFLSEASGQDPRSIVFDYVRGNSAAFGLDDSDLAGLKLTRDYTSIDGTHHLVWAQSFHGIRTFDNDLRASVTADGRLINVMGSPIPHLRLKSVTHRKGPKDALTSAYADAGVHKTPRGQVGKGDAEETTDFAGGDQAHLVLFTEGPGDVHVAWRTRVKATSTQDYDYVVDANDGRLLYRLNTVSYETGNPWDYAPNVQAGPKAGLSGGSQVTKTFPASTSTSALQSSFAHVYPDTLDLDRVDTPSTSCPECTEVPPSSPGTWNYPFTPNPGGGSSFFCSTTFPQCSWDANTAFGWRANLRQDATQVFYFVNNFHDHLLAAPIGFTPAAGNFEGADAVQAEVDDGAQLAGGFPDSSHHDNANMATPADGSPPRMQMYLFTGTGNGGDQNGGDDASVVYHEYTHGLSHRLVTDASGQPALRSFQANAMGEGWSDWYATDYLTQQGFDPDTATVGDVKVGYYTTGGTTIRSEPTDCPVGWPDFFACSGGSTPHTGGYTLGDMGHVTTGPEVHADGEIWDQTLWDLRQRLITDLGATTGVSHAQSLITRAMELAPPDPTFLDMRNAILQADTAAGGADQARIWAVFAGRGMGFFASTINGSDTHPVENFDIPPSGAGSASVRGTIRDAHSGAVIAGATAEFPGHDSGFTTDYRATTNGSGAYSINGMIDGRYPAMQALANGFEAQLRSDVLVLPGSNTVDFGLQRDWVSTSGGATVSSFTGPDFSTSGCGPTGALDLSLGSGWGNTSPSNATSPGAKTLVAHLPAATKVTAFAIDPGATCGDDDNASLAGYKIEVSTSASGPWTQVNTGTFGPGNNHHLNYLRAAGSALANVSFVRLTMSSPQSASGSGADFMDMSELEVYGGGLPTISSFTPTSGITGSSVTITGTNLTGATAVSFNGKAASFTPVSATQINATVPNGATTGKISVTTPGGVATSAANYTVTFSIISFTPASGPTGTVVTLNGVGFTASSVVKFNGVAATTTFVSPTQLTAPAPAAAATGAAPLTVANTAIPTGTITSATSYTKT